MNLLDYACAALSFALVTCLTLYLYGVGARKVHVFLLRRRLEPARERFRGRGGVTLAELLLAEVFVPLGRLATPTREAEGNAVKRLIRQAGCRSSLEVRVQAYYGLRVLLALVLGALYLGPALLWGGLERTVLLRLFVPLAVGYYLPAALLRSRASTRSQKIRRELPDVLDLLKICVEAGLSLDSALFRVSSELKEIAPVMARELAQYFLEIQSGLPRREVLANLAERNQVNALTGVVNVLTQSGRLGTDIAGALGVYSASLRTERMQAAKEQGAKVATRLTFPMILLILPALLLVILGPAMINMFDRLGKAF